MIVVDENSLVRDWLNKFKINNVGITRLDAVTFELANGLDSELILIQDITYKQMTSEVLEKLKCMKAVIIFRSSEERITIKSSNVVSILEPNMDKKLLKNQLNFLEDSLRQDTIVKSQLLSLNNELNSLMGGVESQLLRVKKAYEKTTPKRLEDFKGLTVYSKYAAGDDMGGEFFDTFSSQKNIFILMSACSSYLASSSILENFSEFKKSGVVSTEAEKEFLNTIKNEIIEINKNKKKPVEIKIMTCQVDFDQMKLTGHVFGDFQIMTSSMKDNIVKNSQLDGDFKAAKIEIELERGERLLFNSPGFVANWSLSNPKFLIEELVNNKEIKGLDILDEVYFQLRSQSNSNFLVHDASSIILEVQDNVMVQV